MSQDEETPKPPFLQIVRGNPTDEQIAALTAVLAAAGSAGPPDRECLRHKNSWASPERAVRGSYPQGAGGWRGSGGPR